MPDVVDAPDRDLRRHPARRRALRRHRAPRRHRPLQGARLCSGSLRGSAIVDDAYVLVRDASSLADVPQGVPVIVPLALWLGNRDALRARAAVGVWLAPAEDPFALAEDVASLPVIAVDFPEFTDGRGYSIARLLRERSATGRAARDRRRAARPALLPVAGRLRRLRDRARARTSTPRCPACATSPTATRRRTRARRGFAAATRKDRRHDDARRAHRACVAVRCDAIAQDHAPAVFASSFGAEDMVLHRPHRAARAADRHLHARHGPPARGDAWR